MILEAYKDWSCDVFDANGEPLLYAVWCDTDTGEAVHLVKDEKGFVLTVGEDGKQTVLQVWKHHPAPLTFVRRGNCTTQPRG